jgi:hypothetical protein
MDHLEGNGRPDFEYSRAEPTALFRHVADSRRPERQQNCIVGVPATGYDSLTFALGPFELRPSHPPTLSAALVARLFAHRLAILQPSTKRRKNYHNAGPLPDSAEWKQVDCNQRRRSLTKMNCKKRYTVAWLFDKNRKFVAQNENNYCCPRCLRSVKRHHRLSFDLELIQ